jgi:protein involved in polysaccharide export with SLBB domain
LKIRNVLALATIVILSAANAFSQQAATGQATGTVQTSESASRTDDATERLQLAISSIDYPVTPGDIYQLSYRESAGSIVTRQFQVDGISILDLGVFGKIYALNMPFYELKQNVENLISRNYTYSTPALSIVAPGVFRVAIREGPSQIQYITAWGLSRISEIVKKTSVPNYSVRDIERITREGKSERFDLLTMNSTSLEGGDPLVRPGDTLVLHQAERTIELIGEVRRPGSYELVGSEGLKELIEVFGGGVSRKADLDRLRIIQSTSAGEKIEYISATEGYEQKIKLNDGDRVIIDNKITKFGFVLIEGAVRAPTTSESATALPTRSDQASTIADSTANGRFSHPISDGIKLSDVLREIQASILPTADLGSALVKSPDSANALLLDIRPLLSGADLSKDLVLIPNTSIFLPLLRSTVSVAGAVIYPGFVPYLPGAPASYYVSLCGGFNPERNTNGALSIFDQFGKERLQDQTVMPGDSIFVKSNSFEHTFARITGTYLPVVTTLITLITFGITIGILDISF